MGKVTSLHPELVGGVRCCFKCPFAVAPEAEAVIGIRYKCAVVEKDLGFDRSHTTSPAWCPLRLRPICVKWIGDGAQESS